jgi:hypothetical protein
MLLSELMILLLPFNQTIWSLNPQMLKCKIKVRGLSKQFSFLKQSIVLFISWPLLQHVIPRVSFCPCVMRTFS